jgi:excisionase family DNA binding protein
MQTEQPQPFTISEPQQMAFSIPAACKVTGIGRTKIYAALQSGALIARKNGAKNIILRADLERWLQSLPTQTPSAPLTKSPPLAAA